jgi:serine O-acetyltransferase
MGWWTAIREEIATAQRRDPAARGTLEVLLTYPGIHALITHRLARALWLAGVPLLPRLISNLARLLTGIEIHPGARIGRRLFIDHGMGVVIGETAIIGDDCHLLQGVTLGGTSTRREKRHPTLEDGVLVGAGAKIIGAVTIGAHSKIGAGSVVVSSVPPNATVVGVPGHVIAFTDLSNDTIERLPDPEWDRIDGLDQRVTQIEQRLADARPAAGDPSTRAGDGSYPTEALSPDAVPEEADRLDKFSE